jgi:uncharacterized protein YegL
MDNMTETVILVVLDESGSMNPKREDVIGGFNNFIEEQKKIENDKARLYLIKFNSKVNVVYRGVELDNVPKLDNKHYTPGGDTALYDAVGYGINMVNVYKKPSERAIVMIFTDGKENDSKLFNKQDLRDIIAHKKVSEDWTILYIGEDPIKWSEDSGCDVTDGVQFDHVDCNTNFVFATKALSSYRNSLSKKGKGLFETC